MEEENEGMNRELERGMNGRGTNWMVNERVNDRVQEGNMLMWTNVDYIVPESRHIVPESCRIVPESCHIVPELCSFHRL